MRGVVLAIALSACWVDAKPPITTRIVHVHDTVPCIWRDNAPPMIPCRVDLLGPKDCHCQSPHVTCYQVVDCAPLTYEDCVDEMHRAWKDHGYYLQMWVDDFAWPRCADID